VCCICCEGKHWALGGEMLLISSGGLVAKACRLLLGLVATQGIDIIPVHVDEKDLHGMHKIVR
jgi:hypothetical protein